MAGEDQIVLPLPKLLRPRRIVNEEKVHHVGRSGRDRVERSHFSNSYDVHLSDRQTVTPRTEWDNPLLVHQPCAALLPEAVPDRLKRDLAPVLMIPRNTEHRSFDTGKDFERLL